MACYFFSIENADVMSVVKTCFFIIYMFNKTSLGVTVHHPTMSFGEGNMENEKEFRKNGSLHVVSLDGTYASKSTRL